MESDTVKHLKIFRVISREMPISLLITQLIVIDTASLTVLFCNCPLLKDIVSIQSVCWFGVINQ